MKCKKCKREIPENSIFCCWCGIRQIKEKEEIKVPEPIKLPSGNWFIQLRKEGTSITEPTRDKCITKAKAVRAGFTKQEKTGPRITVRNIVEKYITENEALLSPSTVKAYRSMMNHRFHDVMDKDVSSVDWQKAVSEEIASGVSPKTISNAYRLITASMKHSKIPVQDVRLPKKTPHERSWLDYEDIMTFLDAVYGHDVELAALIMLHGLRLSEAYALTPKSIDLERQIIKVRGSRVYDSSGQIVFKELNKNERSTRDVPIMIPRLLELLQDLPNEEVYLIDPHHKRPYEAINRICRGAGLPEVGNHGLRHSMISLAYHLKWSAATTMQVGGYSNMQVVQDHYTHLALKDRNEDIDRMKEFYADIKL